MSERWTFGEAPLEETRHLAVAVRDLVSTVLALELPHPEVTRLVAEVVAAERRLAKSLPPDQAPRVGEQSTADQRVYLDHSRDVGAYNPCFPVYTLRCADDRAEGTVTFPIAYEGPPGLVHGGFLAVFFDCVLQQLNCDMGLSGKTSDLSLRYRRPVPLRTPLEVQARREVGPARINSEAELRLGGTVLCAAEMHSVVGDRARLPPVSPRRTA